MTMLEFIDILVSFVAFCTVVAAVVTGVLELGTVVEVDVLFAGV